MTPSQRTILLGLAAGAVAFVVLFALDAHLLIALVVGALLGVSVGLAVNYLSPYDIQTSIDDNLRRITQAGVDIRLLAGKVEDAATRNSLLRGVGGIPRMVELIRQRDPRVAEPLSERSVAYLTDVTGTLADYIDIQSSAEPEYLEAGQAELQRLSEFTEQPDRELSERKMNEYINSLTALNLNPPPKVD